MKFVLLTYIRRLIYLSRRNGAKCGLRASHVYILLACTPPFEKYAARFDGPLRFFGINRRGSSNSCYSSPQGRLLIPMEAYKVFQEDNTCNTLKSIKFNICTCRGLMRRLYQVVNLGVVVFCLDSTI